MKLTKRKISTLIALSIAGLPVADIAAEDRVGGLEEIIVSARKRDESLQDAPLTMQAISAERVAKFDITSLERIQQVTPQLYVARVSNGSGAQITMRGIGASSATSIGIEQSVAVILNGAYYGQGRVLNEGMFDLEQVEILKGPQSLFFGKNATAGVISLTTAKPTDEWEGKASVGYEFETEQTKLEGVVSGPLSDTVGMRFALKSSDMDGGWYKNVAEDRTYYYLDPNFQVAAVDVVPGDNRDMPQEEETLARLTMSVDPSDDLSMMFTGQFSQVEVLNSAYNNIPWKCDGGFNASGVPCGDNFRVAHNRLPNLLAENLPYTSGNDLYNEYESWSFNAEIEYTMGDYVLTSITNYQDNENDWALPGDFANIDSGIFATEHATWKAFSEEIRLASDFEGPFNFMVGMLYQETERDFNQWVTFGFASYNAAAPAGLEYTTYAKKSQTDGETFSPFFELRYELTDTIEVTAGARYTDETKESFFDQLYVHPTGIAALGWLQGGVAADQDFDEFSPEATISWQATEEVTLYAAYKTAYKSGGFSNGAVYAGDIVTPASSFTFEPETAEGFEVGIKSTLLDNQLRLNASIYSYEVDDLQLDYFDPAAIVFTTVNAGKATSEGVEFDLEYAPNAAPGLTLRGTLAYNNAEYDEFIAPCWEGQQLVDGNTCTETLPGFPDKPGQDISGQKTGMAPEISASFGFNYDGEFSNGMGYGYGADALYSDDYNASALGNPWAEHDSYVMYNAMGYISGSEDAWQLKLLGKNLGDELVVAGVLESAGSGAGRAYADLIGFAGAGRTVELQLEYRF